MSRVAILSSAGFSILLALSLKPRHGYELMRQVDEDTDGQVQLGAGSLYGSIKQLRSNNLIEEIPFAGPERRHYYRLTKKGWDRLSLEVRYYQRIIDLARQRHLMPKQ